MNPVLAGLGLLAAALAAGKKTLKVGGYAKLRFDVEDFPKGTRVVIDEIRDEDEHYAMALVEVLSVPKVVLGYEELTDEEIEDLIGAETWFSPDDLIPE